MDLGVIAIGVGKKVIYKNHYLNYNNIHLALKPSIHNIKDLVRTLVWLGFGIEIHPGYIEFIKDEVGSSIKKISPKRTVLRIRRLSASSYKRIRKELSDLI